MQIPHKNNVVVVKGVIDAAHEVRPRELCWRIPQKPSSIQSFAAGGKSVRQRQLIDQAYDCGIRSDTLWVVSEDVVAVYAIREIAPAANRNARQQVATCVHHSAVVLAEGRPVQRYRAADKAEDAAAGRRCVDERGAAQRGSDWRSLADPVVLEAAKKEGLILANRPADVESILIQLQIGPGLA